MAAESELSRAQREALFQMGKWLSQQPGLPVGTNATVQPQSFTMRHGARLEKLYGDRIQEFLENGERYGISVDSINEYLRTDPDVALRLSTPLTSSMGLTPEQAQAHGLTIPDAEGNPRMDDSGRVLIRTFFTIDENGYVRQTLSNGQPIPWVPETPGDKPPSRWPGTIYSGLDENHLLSELVVAGIQKKVAASLGLEGDFFKKFKGLDEYLTGDARKVLNEKLGLGLDDTTLERPDAAGNMAFYRALMNSDEALLGQHLKEVVDTVSPPRPPPDKPADFDKLPDEKKKAYEDKLAAAVKENQERDLKNKGTADQYVLLLQAMRGLDDRGLQDVLGLGDLNRIPGFLLEGLLGAGLALSSGVGYSNPWRQDPGLDRMRLWDTIGFGEIYDELQEGDRPLIGNNGDTYYDFRNTASYTIDAQRLKDAAAARDPEFGRLLDEMDLPATLDIQDISKFTMVAYAYKVLQYQNDGVLPPGAIDRLAATYKGEAGGLEPHERQMVTNSINGIGTDGKPPLMMNPKWDTPLIAHQLKHGEEAEESNRASIRHAEWFRGQFGAQADIPGLGAVETTLSEEQGMIYFWLWESENLGFKGQLDRKIPQDSIETINGLIEDPALHVKPGTRYMDMNAAQTIAYFNAFQNKDVTGDVREAFKNETLSNYINRTGMGQDHKDKYKVNMQGFTLDGIAEGRITESVPEPSADREVAPPAPGATGLGAP